MQRHLHFQKVSEGQVSYLEPVRYRDNPANRSPSNSYNHIMLYFIFQLLSGFYQSFFRHPKLSKKTVQKPEFLIILQLWSCLYIFLESWLSFQIITHQTVVFELQCANLTPRRHSITSIMTSFKENFLSSKHKLIFRGQMRYIPCWDVIAFLCNPL